MPDLLAIQGLVAGYGEAVVLDEVDLALAAGESLALLGRNGMGKTTLINSIAGLTRRFSGSIRLADRDIHALAPEARAHAGVGWVPQERNIFRSLTVHENLTAVARPGRWTPEAAYTMFPRLAERREHFGAQLSGGEQQMLAIARALVLNPRLLLLDEPLEGLAPIVADELLRALIRITRDQGLAAIIVEQNARKILEITDRAAILVRGQIVYRNASAALLADAETLEAHLGVAASRRQVPGGPTHQQRRAS
ncbi:MAG: ABC transporter ATP-binding protein [Pseudomonadota bacterium]|nr:ABC transporter ATP-binding protein [Pseudomonadota bacterium]